MSVWRHVLVWPPTPRELAVLLLLVITLFATLPSSGSPSANPSADTLSALSGGVHLVTSVSRAAPGDARATDTLAALSTNAAIDGIHSIHILVDGLAPQGDDAAQGNGRSDVEAEVPPEDVPPWLAPVAAFPTVRLVPWPAQPTYADLFGYASRTLPGRLVTVLHSDIELDERSLACMPPLAAFTDQGPLLLALTRHPHPSCPTTSGGGALPTLPHNLCLDAWTPRGGPPRAVNSADAFVFAAPAPAAVVASLGHLPNRRGAENRLAHVFSAAGYRVENPCHAVRVFHRHCEDGARVGGSSLAAARVDTGGMTRALPRTPLACDAWGADTQQPLHIEGTDVDAA